MLLNRSDDVAHEHLFPPLFVVDDRRRRPVHGRDHERRPQFVFRLRSVAGHTGLTISGADGSGDPAHARPCVFAGAFAGGRLVQTQIDLEPQGSDWIGRSTAASAGTIVVTLRTIGSAGGRHTVSGTISGQATSVMGTPASGPSGVRVVFDSVATQTIDGRGATIGQFVAGNITGAATFIDANAVSSRCDWVQWSLQPMPPG